MLKKFGLLAVAGIAALALGTAIFGGGQSASAETTDVVNVNCSLISTIVPTACTSHITVAEVDDLASDDRGTDPTDLFIGDGDGTLEASDFDEFEFYDASQLSTDCDFASAGVIPTTDPAIFMGCTMLVFTFVDDEKPVQLDNDGELTSLQAAGATTDYLCDTEGDTLGLDNDCSDTADNGDGVVIFHIVNGDPGASRGEEKTVRVSQEAVEQSTELLMVGVADDIEIVLAESIISTSGSVAASNDCASDTPVDESIAPANATTALVTVIDQDNVEIAMWPIIIEVDPPGDDPDVAQLGNNDNDFEDIQGNTSITIDSGNDSLPVGYFTTVCGGSGTGETSIAVESLTDGSTDSADLTVVGFANSTALVAAPAEIACDGVSSSTVTATITDSAGNPVANGTEVTFSVVALGTANPINTTTTDGVATSVITPLSNASAGVTVTVSVADGSDASTQSILVSCALPIATQPTLAPPPTVPTGPISPPDTGNGGYLAQDGASSLWTMIALAIGGTIVVVGGLVARRSSN